MGRGDWETGGQETRRLGDFVTVGRGEGICDWGDLGLGDLRLGDFETWRLGDQETSVIARRPKADEAIS